MDHVDDQLLAAVALDEVEHLPEGDADSVTAHLAECEQCARELSELRETLSLLDEGSEESLTPPPASVWEAIRAELHDPAPRQVPVPRQGGEAAARRGDDIDDLDTEVIGLLPRRRTVPAWLASVAAAAALVVGLGVGVTMNQDPAPRVEPDGQDPTVLGTTVLASLDDEAADRGSAQVRQHEDRAVLHVEAADLDGPDGTREVWLINLDGSRMVSLGLLARGESGEFEFPQRLLDQGYRIVDISYEPDDGDPLHSGQSLARGTLEG